eukprot:Em0024g171a
MLPFELHSSAKIFNAIADALEWRLKVVRVPHVYYYLDDFTVLGAPGTMSRRASNEHYLPRYSCRSFLRRMINLLHNCKNVHYIHLSRGFRLDLQWWKVFATTWNGTSYLASNTTAQRIRHSGLCTGLRGSNGDGACGLMTSPSL